MARLPWRGAWLGLGGVAVLVLLLTVYTVGLGLQRWEAPAPGLLTDPLGHITSYGWPTWSGPQQGLSFPARVIAVEGLPLSVAKAEGAYPADLLDRFAQRFQDGRLRLTIAEPSGREREVEVRVERISGVAWLALLGGYTLVAWIGLLAGGVSYLTRPANEAVGSFSRWTLLHALLLLTAFDFHTTRRLVPLFLLSYALLPAATLELGMRFPDDMAPLRRVPALVLGPRLLGVGLLLAVAWSWVRGRPWLYIGSLALGLSILGLVAMMAVRCILADGRRRTQLGLGLVLWSPLYIALALALLLTPKRAGVYVSAIAVPLTAPGMLGMAYALLRHDLLDSRVLLPRRLLRPMLTAVLGLCAGLTLALLAVGVAPRGRSEAVALGAFLLGLVAVPLHQSIQGWVDRTLLPADTLYCPTVEQLSLWLSDLASQAAVVDAVESKVRQWLPCEQVRFVPLPTWRDRMDDSSEMYRSLPPAAAMAAMALSRTDSSLSASLTGSLALSSAPNEPREWRIVRRTARKAGIDGIGVEQAAALCRGEVVYSAAQGEPTWLRLVIPARFRDQVVGLLAIVPRPPTQRLTSEEENLLRTIANQAALALACANAYEQVESLRQAQQAAFREEKKAALGAFAAEIAHEIRIPINFFRILLDSYSTWLREGRPPEAEHVDIGREEIDRLERMAGNLRRIATAETLAREPVELRPLVEHVRLLLRDRIGNRPLEVEIDPLLDVDCDRDAMTQILINLLTNALDACPVPGRVGVLGEPLEDGRLRLSVWDTGPGVQADIGKIFQPWFTTKKTGSGLGLPITRRLVRAHGWEIGVQRRCDRTCFDVIIPREDWHLRPPPAEDAQFESGPLK